MKRFWFLIPLGAFLALAIVLALGLNRDPREVLRQMLRVGKRAIVSFPNFGHWRIRLQVGFGGHMPQTGNLPYYWWETPNIHFCTIKDFRQLCHVAGVKMEKSVALDPWGRPLRRRSTRSGSSPRWVPSSSRSA